MTKIINIKTNERSYSIEIKYNSIITKLKKIVKRKNKVIIIVDSKVKHLVKNFNKETNLNIIKIKGNEKIKNFKNFEKLSELILSKGIDRKTLLVAIGGGSIGDLVGFIASTLLRGIEFVLIPTTLLSQVDSSIGGKNGINSLNGKNLIGTFYQPSKVIIDPLVLKTLSKRQFKSGYAEIIKHAIINNKSFFEWLEKNYTKIFKLDRASLETAIYKSILIKKKFVSFDTKEQLINNKSRAILNFGHTFGHALELLYKYNNRITHGEAIAIGMIIASKISNKTSKLSNNDLNKIIDHFVNVGLPTYDKKIFNKNIIKIIQKDKKNFDKKINLILIKEIGEAYLAMNFNLLKLKKLLN